MAARRRRRPTISNGRLCWGRQSQKKQQKAVADDTAARLKALSYEPSKGARVVVRAKKLGRVNADGRGPPNRGGS